MLIPVLTGRAVANLASSDEFKREPDKGAELLLVGQDGKSVAGVLLGLDDLERMEALEFGVLGAYNRLAVACTRVFFVLLLAI